MFERYVEKARRCIFFARYEASVYGSPYIETEHLLLGILREDKELLAAMSFQHSDVEALRKRIESRGTPRERISTSVDLPLSRDSKRALAYGAEEAEKFHHKTIEPRHLMLGLLRTDGCVAAELLGEVGVTYNVFADMMAHLPESLELPSDYSRMIERTVERPSATLPKAQAESLDKSVTALQHLVDTSIRHLQLYSDTYGEQLLKRRGWTRKQAMGHLVDWAAAHYEWFATAAIEKTVAGREYPQEERALSLAYKDCVWPDLVDAWASLNRLIAQLLARLPEERVNTPCRIGIEKPIPLLTLAERYVLHNEDIMGQILSKL